VLVLFLLAGDLEVLIRSRRTGRPALDVVGLVAVALGHDVAVLDRTAGGLIAI
jgi:hypothetical protein